LAHPGRQFFGLAASWPKSSKWSDVSDFRWWRWWPKQRPGNSRKNFLIIPSSVWNATNLILKYSIRQNLLTENQKPETENGINPLH
jgi:hypothetical protein